MPRHSGGSNVLPKRQQAFPAPQKCAHAPPVSPHAAQQSSAQCSTVAPKGTGASSKALLTGATQVYRSLDPHCTMPWHSSGSKASPNLQHALPKPQNSRQNPLLLQEGRQSSPQCATFRPSGDDAVTNAGFDGWTQVYRSLAPHAVMPAHSGGSPAASKRQQALPMPQCSWQKPGPPQASRHASPQFFTPNGAALSSKGVSAVATQVCVFFSPQRRMPRHSGGCKAAPQRQQTLPLPQKASQKPDRFSHAA
mmetsp:Transcript_129543/g.375220  ORF Transcript_129543/g.375220 Transcript_129543/m.375220 type:complete len:251 (+) Transcript_129543:1180-1932(+)